MKTTYVPTAMCELKWDSKDNKKLQFDKCSSPSSTRSGNLHVEVDLEKKEISYRIETELDNGQVESTEDSFDYITEKGGLKWLYKALDELSLMKHVEFPMSYILRDIMVYLDNLKLGSALDNLITGNPKSDITKEAVKIWKVLDKKNIYKEPLDDMLWRVTPLDLAELFHSKAPLLSRYLSEYCADAILNILQQKEPSLLLEEPFDEWLLENVK